MTPYADPGHVTIAKTGFLLGLGLFVVGAGGEVLGHTVFQNLPDWEYTLFIGISVADRRSFNSDLATGFDFPGEIYGFLR